MNMDLIATFSDLKDRKEQLEAELKKVNGDLRDIDAQLQEEFVDEGVQSIATPDHTFFLHPSIYAQRAEGVDMEEMCEALAAAGAGALVEEKANMNSVSAWVREHINPETNEVELPPEVEGVLGYRTVTQVRRNKR